MKHPRHVLQSVVLLVLGACASSSASIRAEDAQQVQIGMTEAEVVRLLGSKPADVSTSAGSELWKWNYVVATPDGSRNKTFAVKFLGGKAVWIQR